MYLIYIYSREQIIVGVNIYFSLANGVGLPPEYIVLSNIICSRLFYMKCDILL